MIDLASFFVIMYQITIDMAISPDKPEYFFVASQLWENREAANSKSNPLMIVFLLN